MLENFLPEHQLLKGKSKHEYLRKKMYDMLYNYAEQRFTTKLNKRRKENAHKIKKKT